MPSQKRRCPEAVLVERGVDGPQPAPFDSGPIVIELQSPSNERIHHDRLDRVADVTVQRRVGLMRHRLQVASWALDGALTVVGDDPVPSMGNVVAVMAAKREIVLAAAEVTELAMELGGARTFRSGSPVERAYRDVRAGRFHPFDPETTLIHAGRSALGLSSDQPADWTAS